MKILATTFGETGGGVIGQTLNLGYLTGIGIFVEIPVVVLIGQLAVSRFNPVLFWSVIFMTQNSPVTNGSLATTDLSPF